MSSQNNGRPKPTFGSPFGNFGRAPRTFTYEDSAATGKTYPQPQPKSIQMKASDTPFEPEVISQLIGKRDPQKTMVRMQESVIQVPVRDETGRRVMASGHFLHFSGLTGPQNSVVITPGGEVVRKRAPMRTNMVPGMVRGRGQFDPYSIPPENMTVDAAEFSHFSPMEEPRKDKA